TGIHNRWATANHVQPKSFNFRKRERPDRWRVVVLDWWIVPSWPVCISVEVDQLGNRGRARSTVSKFRASEYRVHQARIAGCRIDIRDRPHIRVDRYVRFYERADRLGHPVRDLRRTHSLA